MKKEESLQIAVATYLNLQYPHVFWCHIANERQTSPQRGAKLKKMGVRAGMPDVMIFFESWIKAATKIDYYGLAIELKIKPNKPTENQYKCLDELISNGWKTKVCYSFDEAKEVIDSYLK